MAIHTCFWLSAINTEEVHLNPQSWLKNNLNKLKDSPFEEMFFCNVLSKIPFDFNSLIAQFQFKDLYGRTRYCDFVYREGDVIRIAIEVDGYDKRGTGTGMSHNDFVDWQRRQAALTAQGWYVLRFANTDVRDFPDDCKKHIEFLLREERQKSEYQLSIKKSIQDLKNQLSEANEQVQHSKAAEEDRQRLEKQIETLQRQLQLAQQAKPLTEDEEALLQRFNASQREIQEISKENKIMKTTIWALTVLAAVTIVALIFRPSSDEVIRTVANVYEQPVQSSEQLADHIVQPVLTNTGLEETSFVSFQQPESKVESNSWEIDIPDERPLVFVGHAQEHRLPEKRPGTNCKNPLWWENVAGQIGKNIAVQGNVKRITYRQDVRGKPTWIEVGNSRPKAKSLTLIIWGDNRSKFEPMLAELEEDDPICVEGLVDSYKGKPQIKLSSLKQLHVYGSGRDNFPYHWKKY